MDLTPYVESLRHDLAQAARAGGPEAATAAERLAHALDPAIRLALMDALSQAAAEITADLPAGSVEVRLKGREPELVVDVPTPDDTPTVAVTAGTATGPLVERREHAASVAEENDDDDGAVARITLRIPESVKARAEELAARSGHSLNSWVVNAVRAATARGRVEPDIDLSSIPLFDDGRPGRRGNRRMTGWV